MSRPYLSITSLDRRLATGNVETLIFQPGVNVFVGPPNTGKTKWLQTLDFLLGDAGSNPYESTDAEGLAEKYDAAGAWLQIGEDSFRIERRWNEPGAKGKIFVGDEGLLARDFQHWLMSKLSIPGVNFPKGNPMSGQTWPELSFRSLLRHMHRQQRFWGGLVDQQPDAEFHAGLLSFLGLANRVYSEDYGNLVKLRLEAMNLKARRDQYRQTLNDLAIDLLDTDDVSLGVNEMTILGAQGRLSDAIDKLQEERVRVLEEASAKAIPYDRRSRIETLSLARAQNLEALTAVNQRLEAADERLKEVIRYRKDLSDEIDRMARAADAGEILSDLRVTHCPACDQAVKTAHAPDHCFVCHQHLPDEPDIEGLGAVRLRFEQDRLKAELAEADDLLDALRREVKKQVSDKRSAEEALRTIEVELGPARQVVAALAQADVSAIDVKLGQAAERAKQMGRVTAALELGKTLTSQVEALEDKIEPLAERVDESFRAIDFDGAAQWLEDGMNAYLEALNRERKNTWKHSRVEVDLTRTGVSFRIGRKKWQGALGGTDSLYFLMAYNYGLLSLSPRPQTHYPGLAIIDVPGEFSGESIGDKENFIVQPFIDLLKDEAFKGAQLIITGAAFTGMVGVHVQAMTQIHVA
jgi:DNA repair exonuclease SbcCD ATPase subunit